MKKLSKVHATIQRALADAYGGRDQLRVDIEALKQRREELADSPLPLVEAEAAVDRYIARLQADCGFNVTAFMYGKAPDSLFGGLPSGAGDKHLLQLVAAFCPEGFRRFYLEKIREAYTNRPSPLSAEERGKAVAALDREIFDAEVSEEAVISDIEQLTGAPLPRRHDADPRAVLGLPYRAAPSSDAPPADAIEAEQEPRFDLEEDDTE